MADNKIYTRPYLQANNSAVCEFIPANAAHEYSRLFTDKESWIVFREGLRTEPIYWPIEEIDSLIKFLEECKSK